MAETDEMVQGNLSGRDRKTHVEAECQCGTKILITRKNFRKNIGKYGEYLCRSCATKKLWEDPDYRRRHEESSNKASERARELWKDPEYRKRQRNVRSDPTWRVLASQRSRNNWENNEYREKIRNTKASDHCREADQQRRRKMAEDPGFRGQMSRISKEAWKNPEYRRKVVASLLDKNIRAKALQTLRSSRCRETQSRIGKKVWESEARRQLASQTSKALWTEKYLKHQREVQSERWMDPEYRERQLKLRQDPIYRKKISEATKKALDAPEMKLKLSFLAKERWENDEYRRKMGAARAEWMKGRQSSLESVVCVLLDSMGITYIPQFPLDHYVFDILVPEEGLLIECQGEYWHSLNRVKRSDSAKFTKIDTYFPEYRILYIFERDFLNPEIVRRKITSALTRDDEKEENQVEFQFDLVKLIPLDPKEKKRGTTISLPEEFLRSFHYAAYGRSAKKIYGAFLNGDLIAVGKFSTVHRMEVATSIGLKPSQVLDLDRFCIHPNYQKKNFASWLISRMTKVIMSDFPSIQRLVAFADSTYGHTGTIYSASGWQLVGTIRPDYHYVSPEGLIVHKKTLYNQATKMSQTESEYAKKNGYEKRFGKEKKKFSFSRKENHGPSLLEEANTH